MHSSTSESLGGYRHVRHRPATPLAISGVSAGGAGFGTDTMMTLRSLGALLRHPFVGTLARSCVAGVTVARRRASAPQGMPSHVRSREQPEPVGW